MASLLVVSGACEGDFYLLGKQTVVIGRGENCPIQIVDDAVSRRHLEIRREKKGGYVAADLESANGTLVNDQPIGAESPLADGDIIRIGRTQVMFSSVDFSDRETAFQHYRRHGEGGKSTIIRKK